MIWPLMELFKWPTFYLRSDFCPWDHPRYHLIPWVWKAGAGRVTHNDQLIVLPFKPTRFPTVLFGTGSTSLRALSDLQGSEVTVMGSAILNWTWLDWSENNSSSVHLRWIHIRRDESFIRNMFFHCVIQRPNGDRLISSLNPEELCSKTHVSVRCAMSFWQVRFSGWFRSIGRISLWTQQYRMMLERNGSS